MRISFRFRFVAATKFPKNRQWPPSNALSPKEFVLRSHRWFSQHNTNRTNQTMTINKLVFSLVGSAALAASAFAGTAPSGKCAKCVAPQVAAPEEDLGLTLAVGYDSHYLFRGLTLGENWISSSLDWTLPLTKDLRLDTGASFGTTAGDNARIGKTSFNGASYDRLELNANLVATVGQFELGAGYRWYHHMGNLGNIMTDGNEVGVNLATKLGPLNFGLGAYHDFTANGWYFEAAVNSEIKLCDRVSLVPGANIGYANHYSYNFEVAGVTPHFRSWTNVGVSLALPIKLTKHATLTPYVAGNFPLNDVKDIEDNQIYGGVSLSVKF